MRHEGKREGGNRKGEEGERGEEPERRQEREEREGGKRVGKHGGWGVAPRQSLMTLSA